MPEGVMTLSARGIPLVVSIGEVSVSVGVGLGGGAGGVGFMFGFSGGVVVETLGLPPPPRRRRLTQKPPPPISATAKRKGAVLKGSFCLSSMFSA